MVATPENNPYRNHAAMSFGHFLHTKGIDHRDLEHMSTADLSSHATQAGLGRVPSGETLKMTHSYLKLLNQPKPADFDPFDGV